MIKNKKIGITIIFFMIFSLFSGCFDSLDINLNRTTYLSHPTKISYNIVYGYFINLSGIGNYKINYNCNLPELLTGSVYSNPLYNRDYLSLELSDNSFLAWNISGKNNRNYELGVSSKVVSQSFLISDLNGIDALTLNQIKENYFNITNQYCKSQGDNTTTFIDPNNPMIKNTAEQICNQANSSNSFILSKEIFKWLKYNTVYNIHQENNDIQPASLTFNLKSGDCDDLSVLYISLCRSIGLPARFISGYLIEERNGEVLAVGHAWAEVFVGEGICDSGWMPVECSCCASLTAEVHQNFGVEDAGHLRLFIDDGSNNSLNASISGPRVDYDKRISIEMSSILKIENYEVLESKELIIDKENYRYYS